MKNNFELWPAIDLISGNPVRLLKGDYEQKTDYSEQFSIEDLSKIFSSFSTGIHVVDLDGAKKGSPVNIVALKKICRYSTVPVEIGGGIRSMSDIETFFSCGVSRVILGTSALKNSQFLQEALGKYGAEKIVVGVDAKDGFVATHGWQDSSSIKAEDFIAQLKEMGVATIIFTDIATDGTLTGPPLATFKKLVKQFPTLNIIASGGVSQISDIRELQKINVRGVIFGKAFYEEKITEKELLYFK